MNVEAVPFAKFFKNKETIYKNIRIKQKLRHKRNITSIKIIT